MIRRQAEAHLQDIRHATSQAPGQPPAQWPLTGAGLGLHNLSARVLDAHLQAAEEAKQSMAHR